MNQETIYPVPVRYYETDGMGIVHHSNYIRWFEDARCAMLAEVGFPYWKVEESGVMIPVVSVSCEYRKMVRYGDQVEVAVRVERYTGVKLEVSYEVRDCVTKEIRAVGTSSHTFLGKNGKLLSLKRNYPEFHAMLTSMAGKGNL